MNDDQTARAETLIVVLREALGQVLRVTEDDRLADLLRGFDRPMKPLSAANRR